MSLAARALYSFVRLYQRFLSPFLGGHCAGQLGFVEPVIAPRDVLVVHLVGHADVVERGQQAFADAPRQVAAVD